MHHCAMIAWEECIMREIDEAEPSAIGRRLAALSSRRKSIAVRSLRRTFGARNRVDDGQFRGDRRLTRVQHRGALPTPLRQIRFTA